MRKMLLGLSLFLAAFGFFLPPAMAADLPQVAPAPSAADLAFLASLAAPLNAPVAPEPAAKGPGGLEKALCSATANCWDGTTRSCQGNNSVTACVGVDSNCPTQRGYVTCDGATQYCPICPTSGGCPSNWCTFEAECASSCFPCDYTYTCNGEPYCTDRCRCIFSTCPV